MNAKFDGHANCYIETGFGKGSIIDFNYDTEPLPGTFPLPGIGPFGLLQNTKMNHYGKIFSGGYIGIFFLKGKNFLLNLRCQWQAKKSNQLICDHGRTSN